MTAEPSPVIVFDAQCVMCSASAQFVLRHDRKGYFRLASMQGAAGAALYRRFGIDPTHPETMIVARGDQALRNSDAVSAVCAGLGWPWRALAILRFIPRFLRDPPYLWLGRNRYRIFGRRESCWVPAPEQAARIL